MNNTDRYWVGSLVLCTVLAIAAGEGVYKLGSAQAKLDATRRIEVQRINAEEK